MAVVAFHKLRLFFLDSFHSSVLILSDVRSSTIKPLSSSATFLGEINPAWSDIASQIGSVWKQTKVLVIVPVLKVLVILCSVLSVMLFIEVAYMAVVILFVKLLKRKPEKVYKWEEIKEDAELGSSCYPNVLVQIPMYNEKEVCQLSIRAACRLSWPSDRLIVQVLDGSTDPVSKELVETECQKWSNAGINVKYEKRDNDNGFKAGALKEGMRHEYVQQCDFVAIFDADFQPEPDFLYRAVPFLVHNPEIALVQARWKFVNADECMMTRLQQMSQEFHFKVEQEAGSSTFSFFGFNGTAGVWRISVLNEAGGWNDQTTVEDLDLAVRACLKGWKFVYVGDLRVKSELPSTLEAYRNQQRRWSCGPANLFRKMALGIIANKKISWLKKFYMIYSFFFIRKIATPSLAFIFYCIILPATVLFPEVEVPKLAALYLPSCATLLVAASTPRSFYLLVFWVLFESVMCLHRAKAVLTGLLETGRINEWVVTKKLGDTLKTKLNGEAPNFRIRFRERVYLLELCVGAYLLFCGCYDLAYGNANFHVFLFFQAMAFFIVGFGYVGTFDPTS